MFSAVHLLSGNIKGLYDVSLSRLTKETASNQIDGNKNSPSVNSLQYTQNNKNAI